MLLLTTVIRLQVLIYRGGSFTATSDSSCVLTPARLNWPQRLSCRVIILVPRQDHIIVAASDSSSIQDSVCG